VDQLFNVDRVGWQLIQQMRLHKDTVNIPIILCTTEGRTVNELQEQLTKANVFVLLKPFNIDELYAVVQQSLFLENEALDKSDLRQLEASVKLN
jgi:DNA-binding response OmpR family regulator